MPIREWWSMDLSQRYWLETTGRNNIGADLLAPQEDEAGHAENPGYVLVTHVRDGDVVLHYDLKAGALVGWSLAEGGYWADEFEWASVPGGGVPYRRSAWVHGLKGPYLFPSPIDLAALRAVGSRIGDVRQDLATRHGGPLYFPFTRYAGSWDNLRPGQPYLSKWPAELVPVVPRLQRYLGDARAAQDAAAQPASPPAGLASAAVGVPYWDAAEDVTAIDPDPFTTDPAVVERGLRGHARTQNLLAGVLRERGLEPLRPGPTDPSFDLAWRTGGRLYVAEVKSTTAANEDRQLRLGLGQVLWYRHLVDLPSLPTVAVLAVEREPASAEWPKLCAALDVYLSWPATFSALP